MWSLCPTASVPGQQSSLVPPSAPGWSRSMLHLSPSPPGTDPSAQPGARNPDSPAPWPQPAAPAQAGSAHTPLLSLGAPAGQPRQVHLRQVRLQQAGGTADTLLWLVVQILHSLPPAGEHWNPGPGGGRLGRRADLPECPSSSASSSLRAHRCALRGSTPEGFIGFPGLPVVLSWPASSADRL